MIVAWAKNLGITPHAALWDYSYESLVMYARATPVFDGAEDGADEWDEALDANDPRNTRATDGEEIFVR